MPLPAGAMGHEPMLLARGEGARQGGAPRRPSPGPRANASSPGRGGPHPRRLRGGCRRDAPRTASFGPRAAPRRSPFVCLPSGGGGARRARLRRSSRPHGARGPPRRSGRHFSADRPSSREGRGGAGHRPIGAPRKYGRPSLLLSAPGVGAARSTRRTPRAAVQLGRSRGPFSAWCGPFLEARLRAPGVARGSPRPSGEGRAPAWAAGPPLRQRPPLRWEGSPAQRARGRLARAWAAARAEGSPFRPFKVV